MKVTNKTTNKKTNTDITNLHQTIKDLSPGRIIIETKNQEDLYKALEYIDSNFNNAVSNYVSYLKEAALKGEKIKKDTVHHIPIESIGTVEVTLIS